MNEIEFIQKLDAAAGDGQPVDVSDRVIRRIRSTRPRTSESGPMWLAALVSALAAAAVLIVAVQTFSGLQDPFGDLLTPVLTAFQ
jgi:hypothetical protein